MNNKGRNHIHSIKPLGTPVPNRINKIITKKENFLPLGIGCHNHIVEKYCHFKDAASNEKEAKQRD
jgi:hypothetical protein